MAKAAADPRVTKRRVTMTSVQRLADGSDVETKAIDYVRPDFLDAYVADAKAKWQHVEVSEEPDAGPGGYEGQTFIPDHLEHPEAGTTFEATEKEA